MIIIDTFSGEDDDDIELFINSVLFIDYYMDIVMTTNEQKNPQMKQYYIREYFEEPLQEH